MLGQEISSVKPMSFSVPPVIITQKRVDETHGVKSWRSRALAFLHRRQVQRFFMGLLVLDVVVLFSELFMLVEFPTCKFIERDGIVCLPTGDASENNEICGAGYAPITGGEGFVGCDENKYSVVHSIELFLFSTTMVILFSFLIELNIEMISLGPSAFFRHFFFALDYIVVTTSIILDLFLHFYHSQEELKTLVAFVVFVRVWRFIRIGHGIVEATMIGAHANQEEIFIYTEKLEALLVQHHISALPKKPDSVAALRKAMQHQRDKRSTTSSQEQDAVLSKENLWNTDHENEHGTALSQKEDTVLSKEALWSTDQENEHSAALSEDLWGMKLEEEIEV